MTAASTTHPTAASAPAALAEGPTERIVVVTKETALEALLVRFGTPGQARFWLEHAGEDFGAVVREHEAYHAALTTVRRQLPEALRVQVLGRELLPQYRFAPTDLVVVLGPDGLVVNTAKYLSGQAIVGVNPDPDRIEGVLLPTRVDGVAATVALTTRGRASVQAITMAEARLSDGQRLLAVNDFFVGARTHVSARYRITHEGRTEDQSSSGLIVSTGAGSTGWLQSVYAGARAVTTACGGQWAAPASGGRLAWDADRLVFAVREPFPSKTTGTSVVFGEVHPQRPLVVASYMADGGVLFSDGVEQDYLAFPRGVTATIGVAAQKTYLVSR